MWFGRRIHSAVFCKQEQRLRETRRLVIHKPSTNNPGKPNSAPHPVCMNGRRTPERKRPSIWGCHLIGRSELITTLARTEKMFQSERKAVLLHIFSKESEIQRNANVFILKMFVKIICNFWRFRTLSFVGAICFVSFADNIGVGPQSPESGRSGSGMAVDHTNT